LKPTQKPTSKPTLKPTQKPTSKPTLKPTQKPTSKPTLKPTQKPTHEPTREKEEEKDDEEKDDEEKDDEEKDDEEKDDDDEIEYPKVRFTVWDGLSSDQQDAAKTIGYDSESWNNPGSNAIEKLSYDTLTSEDPDAEEALRELKINEPTWNGHSMFLNRHALVP
jgi:hypothetical protein